ncbi:hypothetical protein [Aquimarina litoralis]|uniref:hypothetical protein n=1 Tax=Aquimarina litoralis TaxID=584605 RepID=UPI001C593714|nr:hypothetical protein [Aquimarina litoralis]MBW1297637.1 hypothetical protein [Aquimarina litoralis]
MKTNYYLVIIFCSVLANKSYNQIRIGGGVSIDVSIDLPLPEVVIVDQKPNPEVISQPRRIPVYENVSFGEIQNQNGPYGRLIYQVSNAQLESYDSREERVIYSLDSGDILEILLITVNAQDYNYHSYGSCDCLDKNRIVEVLLNRQPILLRDGSLSLQPSANGFHSVINLHSKFEGDFNGTVNF